MLKRLMSVLLIAALFAVPVTASGVDETPNAPHFPDAGAPEVISGFLNLSDDEYERFKSVVYSATRNCESICDVSSFSIPFNETTSNYLNVLVRKGDPESFHVKGISYSLTGGETRCYSNLYFSYRYTKDVYDKMRADAVASAEVLLSGIENNYALDDVVKALILHDRLAVSCEYDVEGFENGTLTNEDYTMYGALVEGRCVCEGYAKAYSYLLERAGIMSYLCDSIRLNHMWNVVFIDGEAYHVDVTWDDVSYDITGYCSHANFLCSTEKFMRDGHDASDYDTAPSSAKYDEAFWNNSNSQFTVANGKVFYVDNSSATLNIWSGELNYPVYDLDTGWPAEGGAEWGANYSCLCSDGKYLYYSLARRIMRFDAVSLTSSPAFEFEPEDESLGIYGISADGERFTVDVNSAPEFGRTTKQDLEFTAEYYTPSIAGDVDADGLLTAGDVVNIKLFCAGNTARARAVMTGLDVDKDGEVTSLDVAGLKRLIAS